MLGSEAGALDYHFDALVGFQQQFRQPAAVVGDQVVEAHAGHGQAFAQAAGGHVEAGGDLFQGGAAVYQQFADQLAHLAHQVQAFHFGQLATGQGFVHAQQFRGGVARGFVQHGGIEHQRVALGARRAGQPYTAR